MTKEERAEKWFQSVPETETIPIQTKMEICSQAAKRMVLIWLALLGVECFFLFWISGGELFDQVADFLNQLAEVSPTKNRYKGLALVGALICLPVLIFPGIVAHFFRQNWIQKEAEKVVKEMVPVTSDQPVLAGDERADFSSISERIFAEWVLDDGEKEQNGFELEEVWQALTAVQDGGRDFLTLIPQQLVKLEDSQLISDFVQVCQDEDSDGFRFEVSVADAERINENVIHEKTGLSEKETQDLLRAYLENRVTPDLEDWEIVLDMRTDEQKNIAIYQEITQLLTDDREVRSRLTSCFESPRAYFKQYADRYDERGISEEVDEATIKWLAIADELLAVDAVIELDWKTGKGEFLYQLTPLAAKQTLDFEENWFDEDDEIPTWCKILDEKWAGHDFCLACMDINSDSYVLFICKRDILEKLVTLSHTINQRFDYAKNM